MIGIPLYPSCALEKNADSAKICCVSLMRRDLSHKAQLVERILGTDEVTGSTPLEGSTNEKVS